MSRRRKLVPDAMSACKEGGVARGVPGGDGSGEPRSGELAGVAVGDQRGAIESRRLRTGDTHVDSRRDVRRELHALPITEPASELTVELQAEPTRDALTLPTVDSVPSFGCSTVL